MSVSGNGGGDGDGVSVGVGSDNCYAFMLKTKTKMIKIIVIGLYKMVQKTWKMTETMANGYSSESTHRELSIEYQHHRVLMVFKMLCILVLWTKLALALEGLSVNIFDYYFP